MSPLRWLLLGVLLWGCASSGPPGSLSRGAAPSTGICERAHEEECVALACAGEDCGLFGCEDVDTEALSSGAEAPRVEPVLAMRPPPRAPPAFRNWRSLGIRSGAQPRMTFHFRYREGFLPALPRGPGKLVHHHLFPQQPELAQWFRANGIDIHKFTILIPEHIHRQIHSVTGRGGLWNQAWRDYRRIKQGGFVTREELHRKAVELIFRFELTGPVVPYNTPLAPFNSMPQLRAP
ncbi:TIGR02269 family lipoprotein [Myxococcus sp. CA039A]|uniref:SitA6 family polymorphic toxin lipoprotein n=1 Tax=Myxococcus sp. CA039A TaxID=2741737 RepID=UPI0020C645A7|nr:TIGR02269 family lipoprotein [Myxococcus sp. CA039A]